MITRGKVVKARKPYLCDLCFNTINVGDRYYRMAVMESGVWFHPHLHENCDPTRDNPIHLFMGDNPIDDWYG